MYEIKIPKIPNVDFNEGVINFNNKKLKADAVKISDKFSKLVLSDEEIASAKKDRAALNKCITTLKEKRTEVKDQFCKPFDNFSLQIDDVIAVFDVAKDNIDKQIKDYEEREKNDKKERIRQFVESQQDDDFKIPFDTLFDESYLNKSYKDKAWVTDILEKIKDIESDFNMINDLAIDDKDLLKTMFKKSWDLKKAKAEYEELKQTLFESKLNTHKEVKVENTMRTNLKAMGYQTFKIVLEDSFALELIDWLDERGQTYELI